jgi:hypothetical protein
LFTFNSQWTSGELLLQLKRKAEDAVRLGPHDRAEIIAGVVVLGPAVKAMAAPSGVTVEQPVKGGLQTGPYLIGA